MPLVLKSDDMAGIDAGAHTTVTAEDTVQTDLREVKYVVGQIATDIVVTDQWLSIKIPDQATSPGAITIETWQPTAVDNALPEAATGFGIVVNWIAVGL